MYQRTSARAHALRKIKGDLDGFEAEKYGKGYDEESEEKEPLEEAAEGEVPEGEIEGSLEEKVEEPAESSEEDTGPRLPPVKDKASHMRHDKMDGLSEKSMSMLDEIFGKKKEEEEPEWVQKFKKK